MADSQYIFVDTQNQQTLHDNGDGADSIATYEVGLGGGSSRVL